MIMGCGNDFRCDPLGDIRGGLFCVISLVERTMGSWWSSPWRDHEWPGLIIPFPCGGMVMMAKLWSKRGKYSEPTRSGGRQLAIVKQNQLNICRRLGGSQWGPLPGGDDIFVVLHLGKRGE